MDNEKLAAAAKAGDNEALIELWESVRRLCFRIAGRYGTMLTRAGLGTGDIEQELFLAYHAALTAFDPSGEYKFTTYLTRPVMNALRAALGIRSSRELPPVPLSLNEPLGDEEECTRGDLLPDSRATEAFEATENSVWNEQLRDALEQCLDSIDERTAAIIRGRFLNGYTREALANQAGISPTRAQQLERKGMRQLRQGKNLSRLKAFRDEIISTRAYHGTGLSAWRFSGSSVEERIVLRLEELENSTQLKT